MKTPRVAVVTIALLLFNSFACQPDLKVKSKKPIEIDIGSVTGNVYENKTLGFKLKFPETMVVDSREELDAGLKEGIEFMKKGERKHDKSIEAMAGHERIVFGLNTPDSEAFGYLNITVKGGSGEGELKDMTARTLQLIVDSKNAKVVKPVSYELLNGINVATFVTSVEMQGAQVYTKVYGMRRNGHLVSFTISYLDDSGFKLLENVLNAIEFF